jgi:hypothetical protein
MILTNQGKLIAAIEFKSHVGTLDKSEHFGKNMNNRVEEVLGTAIDFWTAFREGAFKESPAPFVGWLMLLEDCTGSSRPLKEPFLHFPVHEDFQNTSCAQRYEMLCRKLVREKLYTAATLLLSPRSGIENGEYRELSELTGLKSFVAPLAAHIAAAARG